MPEFTHYQMSSFQKRKKSQTYKEIEMYGPFKGTKLTDNDPEDAPPLRLLDKGFLKTASLKRLKELQEDKDKGKQGINEIRISIK